MKKTSRSGKPGLATRQAASKLLSAIIDKQTSMDGLLDPVGGNPVFIELNDQDRLLVKAIILTTLRNYQTIDGFIDSLLDKPLPSGARALQHILFVAAAQILYLDVPDHSAVDLAVEQANIDPRNRRFAKLVNAVLRGMSRKKRTKLPILEETIVNLPEWYFDKLQNDYGIERAKIIASMIASPPSVDIRVKSDPEFWAKELDGFVLDNDSVRIRKLSKPVHHLPGFEDGQWWVQDAAASIPALLFGDIKGKRVVDLCAAPGGKTAQLILAGADVTALDRSKSRLNRLNENLKRLGLSTKTHVCAMEKYTSDELFDCALLDAPCSSTGTIRRHPDILWTKTMGDITYLAQLQYSLLEHAITLVKRGGMVVFSNCSMEREEGEDMIKMFLENYSDRVELIPVSGENCIGFEQAITDNGMVRTYPDFIENAEDKYSEVNVSFSR